MATSKEFDSKVHIKCRMPTLQSGRLETWKYKSGRVIHRNSINLNLDSFPGSFVECAKADVAPWGLEFRFCLSHTWLQCEQSPYLQYFCFCFSLDLQRQIF